MKYKIIHYLGKTYSVPDYFNPEEHDLADFLNNGSDPFAKISDIVAGNVASVNGQTGIIVLDQDDIADGTTYKQFSATEKAKLAGIAAGAEVNVNADWNSVSGDSQILNKPIIPTSFTVRDSFGIVIIAGDNEISLGYKNLYRVKANGTIISYTIESYEKDTNSPISGSISINVRKNGSIIGSVVLSSQSINNDSTLSGWTTSVLKDDKIQYEVISNSGIKNLTLTLFFNHSTI